MRKYLLPELGGFYKANLHMHTTVSDGRMTPEETKKVYKDKGYSIVAFSDHELLVPHNDLTDENFLAITACEIGIDNEDIKCIHLNLYAKDKNCCINPVWGNKFYGKRWALKASDEQKEIQFPRSYSIDGINAIIKKANEAGFLVSYNHPVWSHQNYEDYKDMKGIWGIELYNTGCERGGLHDSIQPLRDFWWKEKQVFPLATDDAHKIEDCFGGWVMIKSERLDYESVMGALERGDFYASTGPQIKELYIENGFLYVKTSQVKEINLLTELSKYVRVSRAKDGELINESVFDINAYLHEVPMSHVVWSTFFRVEVVDFAGNKAYSRAYFTKEIL